MQAIILAGGQGTRLRSVVADKPKVLSPVAGRPFLDYIIQYLQKQGVNSYVFSLGYLSEQIIEFLQENHPYLKYQCYIEETPLGTGGGIRKALELATAENLLVVNADTFFDVPLQQMMRAHQASNAFCTVSLKTMNDFDRYGSVQMDAANTITSFKEKTFIKQGLINGGYLIINKDHYLKSTGHLPETFSIEKEFLEKNIGQTGMKGFLCEGYFIDIGIPEDFLKAQAVFAGNWLK